MVLLATIFINDNSLILLINFIDIINSLLCTRTLDAQYKERFHLFSNVFLLHIRILNFSISWKFCSLPTAPWLFYVSLCTAKFLCPFPLNVKCISRKRKIREEGGSNGGLYRFVRSLSYSMVNQIVIIVELQKKDEFRSGGNYGGQWNFVSSPVGQICI